MDATNVVESVEVWLPVKSYEGIYEVSNTGQVRSLDRWVERKGQYPKFMRGRILKQCIDRNETKKGKPYLAIVLCKNATQKTVNVHRLVALAFIPNPNNLPEVNHIDGDKFNNRSGNLCWSTGSQNMKHAYKTGLVMVPKLVGEQVKNAIYNESQIRDMRTLYDSGAKPKALAAQFGGNSEAIRRICQRKKWRHIA